jgi:hypothetical protein
MVDFSEGLLSHYPLRNPAANNDDGFWFWMGMSQCYIHYCSSVVILYNFSAQTDRFAQGYLREYSDRSFGVDVSAASLISAKMLVVVHWELGLTGFINSFTVVLFSTVALNGNVYTLNCLHCQFQSHFVIIVTFLDTLIQPWKVTVGFMMSVRSSVHMSVYTEQPISYWMDFVQFDI